MPYTPPTQRSPAGSANPSPDISRRSSYQPIAHSSAPVSSRPGLPRSTSYLTRQRRANPVKAASFSSQEHTPPSTADRENSDSKHLDSLRQSPPPVTDDSQIPSGAVISPPDSAQNSSDDEVLEMGGSRGRELENLAELQAAIRIIEQRKGSSPTRTTDEVLKASEAMTLVIPSGHNNLENATEKTLASGLGLRKITHHRSKTDTSIPILGDMQQSSTDTPLGGSDEDSDVDEPGMSRRKPQMLRKKSGELVRPALRPASAKRRPSSMPGTPTFGKAVHFDSHLEHIRHFLQVDRPLAVSAGSSPVDPHDSDCEFPFDDASPSGRSPPFEWEIITANFPTESPIRLSQPARVERIFLSSDNKTLVGSIAVANLAFNKWVVARFTLDYWKTTSEVVAEYNHDVRQAKLPEGRDRFNFNIKLADLANLEAKTMFFCVKYCVNGQEYWDNNNGHNFQVDFKKKALPQNGKKGMQGASSRPSLPRSNNKKLPVSSKPKPTAAFDDFDGFDTNYNIDFRQPVNDYLGDGHPIRLKGVKSAVSLSSNSPLRKKTNSGQAFGNRYDFSASLSAAKSNAINVLGDKSGLTVKTVNGNAARISPDGEESASPLTMTNSESFMLTSKADAFPGANGTDSPRLSGHDRPGMASQSYNELLDKYCFFGSAKSSPQLKEGTLRSGQYDGANDQGYILGGSTESSSDNSPVMMEATDSPTKRTRAASPAPMTGLVTGAGTSPMYPYQMHSFPFHDAHSATAIQG